MWSGHKLVASMLDFNASGPGTRINACSNLISATTSMPEPVPRCLEVMLINYSFL